MSMLGTHSQGDPMLALRSRRAAAAALVALAPLAACGPAVSTTSTTSPASGGPTTLLVRLGVDTLAMEQYTRTPTRMDGVLVQRVPFATIARYGVDIGANSAPTRAEFSLRRADGAPTAGALQSLSVIYGPDSVTFIGHRSSGDSTRATAARGELLPYVNGSYGLFEIALDKLRASGRDSAVFQLVPLNFNVRNTSPRLVRLIGADSARIDWFGSPLYVRHDGRAGITGMDGSRTTAKVRVDRVATTNLDTLASAWAARDKASGAAGIASARDTTRATIGSANLLVDYGRPSLRGRDVWVNGVLGDTIWRTGANAATQLQTDADIMIGGTPVPAGKYTLWTWTSPSGYHLIVNRQNGQWGTEYHADRDLARIPLRESTVSTPAERFTIAVDPQGAGAGLVKLTWGTKQLSVPITAR